MTDKTKAPIRGLNQLSTKQVRHAADGDHSDGGGLMLRVRGASASWVLRYTAPTGKRREKGLGPAYRGSDKQAGDSLTSARDLAHRARELLRQGVDPIDEAGRQRQAAQEAEHARKAEARRSSLTLCRAARAYHERVIEPTKTTKHAADWIASLENHLPASVWHKPIADVEAPELLRALSAATAHERSRRVRVGDRVSETVLRIRQRLDAIFEDGIFHGHCARNPAAAIKRKMRETLPAKPSGEFKALPYREAPALLARVRAAEGTAARALEFGVLTASRTREVLFASWDEIDLEAGTFVLPAERMKAKEPHTVHLSLRALEILRGQVGQHPRWVFPSPMKGSVDKPLSNMAMLTALGRLGARDKTTVHGLCRATFSTWANETGAARPDVIEACLAHEESNRVRAAYNRAQFTQERAALLAAWADFLEREPAQVVALDSRRAA